MDLQASDWFWWVLALLLWAAEAALPGVFLLWFGIAAAGTGLLHLLLPGMSPLLQWIVFSLLSLVAVYAAWQVKRRYPNKETDQPLLNKRAAQLVGRVYMLESAIVNGRGRLKVGDAFWHVEGPDLEAGTRVRVLGVHDLVLHVAAVE